MGWKIFGQWTTERILRLYRQICMFCQFGIQIFVLSISQNQWRCTYFLIVRRFIAKYRFKRKLSLPRPYEIDLRDINKVDASLQQIDKQIIGTKYERNSCENSLMILRKYAEIFRLLSSYKWKNQTHPSNHRSVLIDVLVIVNDPLW